MKADAEGATTQAEAIAVRHVRIVAWESYERELTGGAAVSYGGTPTRLGASVAELVFVRPV